MPPEDEDNIEQDIRNAMSGGEPAPAVQDAPVVEAAPVAPAVEKPEGSEDGRVRGPDGKFVAKTEETAQDVTDQPLKAEPEQPSNAAIRVPSSWSPEAKAQFATLSPAVQAAIAKRETEIEHGLRKKDGDIKRYEPLEQMLAPRRDRWAVQGMDDVQAIKTLLAAQDLLDRDPVQGITLLAKSYGVDLNTAQPAGQPQAQPQGNSQDQALLQRIAHLEQSFQQAQTAPLLSQVDAFKADPANLYFENVRDDMAVLLNSGKVEGATDAERLKNAYEAACWMRSDIRPFLQIPQVQVVDPGKAERAKAAGVSVTGTAAGGTIPPASTGDSLEDDIRAAMAAQRA